MQVKKTNQLNNTYVTKYMPEEVQKLPQETQPTKEVEIDKERGKKINAYSELIFQLYEVCKENPSLLNDDNKCLAPVTIEIKVSAAKAKKAVAND